MLQLSNDGKPTGNSQLQAGRGEFSWTCSNARTTSITHHFIMVRCPSIVTGPCTPNAHHSSRPLLAAFQESLVREIDEQATTSRRAMLRAAAAAKTQAYKQRRASSEQQSYEDLITTLDRQCREGLFR